MAQKASELHEIRKGITKNVPIVHEIIACCCQFIQLEGMGRFRSHVL